MARNEYHANESMIDAYAAFCDERARWVQVLSSTGTRPARRTVKRGIVARIVALFA